MGYRKGGQGAIGKFLDENKSILQPAYETTAGIGKVYSVLSTIFGTLILLIFLFVGIWMVRKNKHFTGSTQGTVKEAKCNTDKDNKTICVVTIEYTVNNKKYTKTYTSSDIVNKNDIVSVRFDPANPNSFEAGSSLKWLGWIFIIASIAFILMIWAWLVFTLFFKPVAAATGVAAIADFAIPDN